MFLLFSDGGAIKSNMLVVCLIATMLVVCFDYPTITLRWTNVDVEIHGFPINDLQNSGFSTSIWVYGRVHEYMLVSLIKANFLGDTPK